MMIRIDQGKQEQRQRKSGKERPDEGGSIDLWMTIDMMDGRPIDRPTDQVECRWRTFLDWMVVKTKICGATSIYIIRGGCVCPKMICACQIK